MFAIPCRASSALFLGTLSLLGVTGPPASADPANAFSLVAEAIAAKHRISYGARQDIWLIAPKHNGDAATETHIVADVVQAGTLTRLTYLLPDQAQGRAVVDDGTDVRQWDPQHHLILIGQSHEETRAALQRMLRLLRRNYRFRVMGRSWVNGYRCDQIAVRPQNGHIGPTRIMWIEQVRHAVLRAIEYGTDGRQRYLSFYEKFRYVAAVPRAAYQVPATMPVQRVGQAEEGEPTFAAAFRAGGVSGRLPCWLPQGYDLVSCAVLGCGQDQPSVILRYSDGLKMLTVIESKDPPTKDRRSVAKIGQPQDVWSISAAGLNITVILDSALPDTLGRETMIACEPAVESRLQRAVAQEFGRRSLRLARRLRRRGWGYDRIVALCLALQARRLSPTLPQIMPTSPPGREPQARRWIAARLNL